ncbi:hypothetical protein [Lysobacter terrae]
MAENDSRNHRVLIATAIIGILGTIGAAALNNWDKIFPKEPAVAVATPPPPVGVEVETTGQEAHEPYASVKGVDLGNRIDADNAIVDPSTTFTPSDTFYASVNTSSNQESKLTARWSFQDGQEVSRNSQEVPAGDYVTAFNVSKPDGWPIGLYRVEILLNSMVVTTVEFEVKDEAIDAE